MTPVRSVRRPGDLRRSLRFVTMAWVFGSLWLYTVSGAALTQYGKQLGLSKFWFGVLGALPFAGALIQLPASYCVARFGHRKPIFVTAAVIHRLLWLPIAAIPWIIPHAWWWPALLWLAAVSWAFGHVSSPAWVSWMADLVPDRMRGRYFSRRTQVGQLVGLATTMTIGYVLDLANQTGGDTLLKTLSVAVALAAVAGTIDILFFLPVREAAPLQPDSNVSLWQLVRAPVADRNFRRFLAFTFTLTFAIGYVGQFAWLYLFDVVGLTNLRANILLVVIPSVVLMIFTPLWGRILDRFGRKPVLLIAGLLVVHGGAAWVFVTREHWVIGYLAAMIATAAWPGVELANFNIMLGMSAATGGKRGGSIYVAINSLVGAVAGILSGLFGGAIAEWLGDWQGALFGWPLTYHGVLFLISGAMRFLALGWLIGLEDRGAGSARAALRYMSTNLYSNLQQAIFMPGRLLLRFTRWTYALPAGKRPRSTSSPANVTNRRETPET